MSYFEDIEQVLARDGDVSDGMAALLAQCEERYPHPRWDLMSALDYQGAAEDLRGWLLRQTIPDEVEVIWFAMWDVTTGFDLRGSTSWSRDPEDWEWWYHDDFNAGTYAPPVLRQMHDLADQTEDPKVRRVTDICLTLGFVSLAAVQALRSFTAPAEIGRQQDLWAVSGHPDEVYGFILGQLTEVGFKPFAQT